MHLLEATQALRGTRPHFLPEQFGVRSMLFALHQLNSWRRAEDGAKERGELDRHSRAVQRRQLARRPVRITTQTISHLCALTRVALPTGTMTRS